MNANAKWTTSELRQVCAVCHKVQAPGTRLLEFSHQHGKRNQPWSQHYLCVNCAPKVESHIGKVYPGPPPRRRANLRSQTKPRSLTKPR